MAIPQVFWDWAQWKDQGSKGNLPKSVARYYNQHKIKRAPLAWKARYAVHKGYKPPPPPQYKPIHVPPPPEVPALVDYRCPIICAETPEACLGQGIPNRYTFWLTADPAYEHNYTQNILDQIHHEGHMIGAWCNPVQVSVDRLREFAGNLGISPHMMMGQFETAEEFDASLGLPCAIGNCSALRPDQMQKVRENKILLLVEDYWNVMPWMHMDFRDLPVVCTVKGTYDGANDSPTYGRYLNVNDYRLGHRWSDGDGIYHANGSLAAGYPDDVKQLR